MSERKFPERWELYEEGLNDSKIASKVGVSPSAIQRWRRKRGLTSNFNRNSDLCTDVSLEPTRNLGYFCGLVIGDGSLKYAKKTRNYRIKVNSTKTELVRVFESSANKLGLKVHKWMTESETSFSSSKVTQYGACVDSKILYEKLKSYKLDNHKFDIPRFLSTNESEKGFLSGYFDSEGGTSGKEVRADSKWKSNLEKVKRLLIKNGISATIYPRPRENPTRYRIRIFRHKSIKRFAKLVNFRIERKRENLKRIVDKIPSREIVGGLSSGCCRAKITRLKSNRYKCLNCGKLTSAKGI